MAAAVMLLMVISPLAGLVQLASSEPTMVVKPDGSRELYWNFTDAASYNTNGTTIAGGFGQLTKYNLTATDTTRTDFESGARLDNVSTSTVPDSVVQDSADQPVHFANITDGPVLLETYIMESQPTAQGEGFNNIYLCSEVTKQERVLFRFDLSSIPSNAVILNATLLLYLRNARPTMMVYNIYEVTQYFNVSRTTWNRYAVGSNWITQGGDYVPVSYARGTINETLGWKALDLSRLVDLWVGGEITNNGMIVTPVLNTIDDTKTFVASHDPGKTTQHPKLFVNYTLPTEIIGEFESRPLGPGSNATFTLANWTAAPVSLASDEFSDGALSERWSWSNDPTKDGGSYSETVRPGWLRITGATNTNLTGPTTSANHLYQSITGQFASSAHLEESFTTNTMGAGVLMYDDNLTWAAIYKSNLGASGKIHVDTCEGGVVQVLTIAWPSETSAYLRMERIGASISFYASHDGAAWIPITTYTSTRHYMDRVMVGPFVYSGNAVSMVAVDFDYFRIYPFSNPTWIEVRERTGNSTSFLDSSWTSWSAPLPDSDGSTIGRASKYVEYKAVFGSTLDWYSVALREFDVHYELHSRNGTIVTQDVTIPNLRRWYTITTTEFAGSQHIWYNFSDDHGMTWSPLGSGGSFSMTSTSKSMMIMVDLSTDDTLVTPRVDQIVAAYSVSPTSIYLSTPATVVAGQQFSFVIEVRDEWNQTLTAWTGPISLTATDASGTLPASMELDVTDAWISTGGRVTVPNERYNATETIRILATAEGAYGLSAPITFIAGSVYSIEITPIISSIIDHTSQTFTATAYDSHGNIVPNVTYTWSIEAGIGSLNTTDGRFVRFTAGAAGFHGNITVTAEGLVSMVHINVLAIKHAPEIDAPIPVQNKDEDFGSWSLNIAPYVSDEEDADSNLRWFVTNESLVYIDGENDTGLLLNIMTLQDRNGWNNITLWIVDTDNMYTTTILGIYLRPINDAPTIDMIDPLVVKYEEAYSYNFVYYVHDVDNALSELSLSTDPDNRQFALVSGLQIIFLYPRSFNGTEQTVTVTVKDPAGDSDATVVLVRVTDDGIPFTKDHIPDQVLDQGQVKVNAFNLTDYFDDPDGDVLYFAFGNSHTTIVIGADERPDFYAPWDWSGQEYVVFRATDSHGARVEQGIVVTVNPVNQPPYIENVPDLMVRYDVTYVFDLTPYISDADESGEVLTVFTNDMHIMVVGKVMALLYPFSMNGTKVQVVITVFDGELSDSWTINVTVSDNYPPESFPAPDHSFFEDNAADYPMGRELEEFFDDAENGHSLSFYVFLDIENVTAETGYDGTKWFVSFDPEKDWYGRGNMTIRATDSEGAIVEETVDLYVISVPDAPVLMLPTMTNVTQGTNSIFDISIYIIDPDSVLPDFRFSLDMPEDALGKISIVNGILKFEFPEDFLGEGEDERQFELRVTVIDQDNMFTTDNITIRVMRAPVTVQHSPLPWLVTLLVGGLAAGLFFFAAARRKKPFVIRDLMLIHNDGFLIARHAAHLEGEIDENIMSGMMTAVLNFVEDSMSGSDEGLKTFGFKEYQVVVERGKKCFVSVVYEGDEPEDFSKPMKQLVDAIEKIYKKKLVHWTGDIETDFAGVDMLIGSFVKEHSKKGHVGRKSKAVASASSIFKPKPAKPKVKPKQVKVDVATGQKLEKPAAAAKEQAPEPTVK
jgi:hypothetical protein